MDHCCFLIFFTVQVLLSMYVHGDFFVDFQFSGLYTFKKIEHPDIKIIPVSVPESMIPDKLLVKFCKIDVQFLLGCLVGLL